MTAPALTYRRLRSVWPRGEFRKARGASTFKITTQYKVETFVREELARIKAQSVVVEIDIPDPQHWNTMGKPYADARPKSPAVILSFSRRFASGRQTDYVFPCDTYTDWLTNLYAIGKTLENLRGIERWGAVPDGLQYSFLQLPAASATTMTKEQAAEVLEEYGEGLPASFILEHATAGIVQIVKRTALNRSHPDNGGSTDAFQRVTKAIEIL